MRVFIFVFTALALCGAAGAQTGGGSTGSKGDTKMMNKQEKRTTKPNTKATAPVDKTKGGHKGGTPQEKGGHH